MISRDNCRRDELALSLSYVYKPSWAHRKQNHKSITRHLLGVEAVRPPLYHVLRSISSCWKASVEIGRLNSWPISDASVALHTEMFLSLAKE
jgi:hypothetical protein